MLFGSREDYERYCIRFKPLILTTAREIQENPELQKKELRYLAFSKSALSTGGSLAGVHAIFAGIDGAIEMLVKEGVLKCTTCYCIPKPEFQSICRAAKPLSYSRELQEFRLLLNNKVCAPFSKELRETKISLTIKCIKKHQYTPEIIRRCAAFCELLPEDFEYRRIFSVLVRCLREKNCSFETLTSHYSKYCVYRDRKISEELKNKLLEICEIDKADIEKMYDYAKADTKLKFIVIILLYCLLCGTPLIRRKYVYTLPQKKVTK